jgi:hypothetical protein
MMIKTEDEYHQTLGRIVKGAEYIANPLTEQSKRIVALRKYDRLVEEAQAYRRSQMVTEFPEMREVYKKLGWSYGEPEQPYPDEKDSEIKPDHNEEPVQEKAVNLSAWLDDD